jgi:hypothetical protein
MKSKAIIKYFIIIAILLISCNATCNLPGPLEYQKQDIRLNTTIALNSLVLGSKDYVNEIQKVADKAGNQPALSKVMEDVNKYGYQIDKNDPQNNLRLYKLVSSLIQKVGYVDMKSHYFRNKLNRAPKTLKEMLRLNAALPSNKRWRLYTVPASVYHMQNVGGEFNLKFVSANGFCEAVYNKKGLLLTEKNDPVNMGTFNYSPGIHEAKSHYKYDIEPYLRWGNSSNSPQKGVKEIRKGIDIAMKRYKEHASYVKMYRMGTLGGIIQNKY